MSKPKACIIGSTVLAVECAKIIQEHNICVELIFTDDQAVSHWATQQQIPTRSQTSFRKFSSFSQFDYLFSIVNDMIVGADVLCAVKKLCINYHDGPLPKYSGVGASQWAIINGETKHGISWHKMDAKIDSGEVLEQIHFTIEETDDLFEVNLKCTKEALTALQSLCTKLNQGECYSVTNNLPLDMNTSHRFDSKPSAFCLLPFHKRAYEVKNFFRGTFTLGKLPQINLLGLPKLFLPTHNKIAIVGSLEISSNNSNVQPGTVVKIDLNSIQIATKDKDVIVSDVRAVDGKPLKIHKKLQGFVLNIPCANDESSSFYKLSKLVASYEHRWMKLQSRLKPEPPIFWPYRSFYLTPEMGLEDESSYSEEYLTIIKEEIVQKLQSIIDLELSQEITALGAILTFIMVLSPTLSGNFDIYCNNIPDELKYYVLHALPLSLKIEPSVSFRECLTTVCEKLSSVMIGDAKEGVRRDLVCSDIYSRYPGIISEPNNVFGVATTTNRPKGPCCNHEVILLSTAIFAENEGRSVAFKALVKKQAKTKYTFSNFAYDFEIFVASALKESESCLANIPLSNPSALDQITQQLSGHTICRKQCYVHEPIEEIAKLYPHLTAIVNCCHIHTTYGEIKKRSDDIACYLKQLFMSNDLKNLRIVLLLGRTSETIAAMLAALKLGSCFVMMESCSSKHLAHIIESCEVNAVLLNADAVCTYLKDPEVNLISLNIPFIYIDMISEAKQTSTSLKPLNPNLCYDPAIIVSTSGTTGKPKSVQLKHSSVCNYVMHIIDQFGLQRTQCKDGHVQTGEISLACTSFNFDGSLHDILPILWVGGTLYFHPLLCGESKQWKSIQSCVTFFFTQPIKLPYFDHERFCSLRNLSIGGESFSSELIQPWFAPERKVWNIYGPCETTIGCTVAMISNGDLVTLGKPVSNVVLRILNPLKQSVPMGVPGELHIGGVGLSLMYTQTDLNEVFWEDSKGKTFYKTSDLVVLERGQLHFLSRIPKSLEVKLHGIRIELSGIKTILHQIPGITFTHVEVESTNNKPKLLVYYVAAKSAQLNHDNIKATIKRELSSFNIPLRTIRISESDIPSTPAGKLDLKRLPSASSSLIPAKTKIEERVLESYQKCLELDDDTRGLFGMDSDFFEYGGNSVAVVSLAQELSTILEKTVSTNDILYSQSPMRLLEAISQSYTVAADKERLNVLHSNRKLSYFQEVLISNNALKVGPTYNMAYVLHLEGKINSLRLSTVLEIILSHLHAAYKHNTTYSHSNWHLNSSAKGNSVHHVDYSYLKNPEDVAMNDIKMDSVLPINFKLCPYRCTLYRLGNTTVLCSVILHHLVFDQQTLLNIENALKKLYKDPCCDLQDREHFSYFISYEDQVTKDNSSSLKFWKNMLNGCAPFVDFPTTFARGKQLTYYGNTIKHKLPKDISSQMSKFCAQLKVSPPSLLLATFGLLIHRFSSSSHSFAIGCTRSLRSSVNNHLLLRKFEKMYGILVNVIPCVFPIEELKFPEGLISHVSMWFKSTMNHTWYPFSKLVELWCGAQETKKPLRLPQFIFNFLQSTLDQTSEMGQGIKVKRYDICTYTAKAELLLEVTLNKSGIFEMSLEYNTGLFSQNAATQILNKYRTLLIDIINYNYLSPLPVLCDLNQPVIAAHFHHLTDYDRKLTKHQHAIYKRQMTNDKQAQFHSSFSVHLNRDIKVLQIAKILEQFPQLAVTICKNANEIYMTVRDGAKIEIHFEYVSGTQEAMEIKHRIFAWPMDINSVTEPLFRCTLIENSSTKQKELFCVSHCILLDEASLHSLVFNILQNLQQFGESPSMIDPYTAIFNQSQYQIQSDFNPMLCGRTVLPLKIYGIHLPQHLSTPKIAKFQTTFNLNISTNEYISFCCLLSSILLSNLQKSCHIHFALHCPDMNLPLCCNETLLPVCLDLNTECSLSYMINAIKSRLCSIYQHTQTEEYDYWGTQDDLNPIINRSHEMLVKIFPATLPSSYAEVFYPQMFPLCVMFCYHSGEIQLLSLLGHEQTIQAQNCFNSLLHFLQKNTSTLEDTAISDLNFEYTPSIGSVDQKCQDTDLAERVGFEFSNHKHTLLFCEPKPHLDHDSEKNFCDVFFTYNETKRLADHLSQKINEVSPSKEFIITILVRQSITLQMCMIASILSNRCFTVLDAFSEPASIHTRLSTISTSVSLMIVDTESLNILDKLLDLLVFPIIIADPYLDESSLPCSILNRQTTANSITSIPSDSVADSSFLVFTSGSTGIPKPVPVLRKSLINFLEWFKESAFENEPLRVMHFTGHSFDVLVAELLVQFLCGGMLVLTDARFKLYIRSYILPLMLKYSIEALYTVPTVLGLMLNVNNFSASTLPHLKHILSTGEKLQVDLCSKFFLHFQPGKYEVILHNWGGPSECCIGIAHCKVNEETGLSEIPYGYLIPGCEVMVCGLQSRNPVPLGYAGEVLVSGIPVFDGYLKTRGVTETPFCYIQGKKWYCTGDIAILNKKHQLIYLQRLDKQLKVSGQRINLDGMRHQILGLNLSYLIDVVVLHIDQDLLCFPLISDNISIDERTVQSDLSNHLSGILLPTVVKCLTKYPMLGSQKLDYTKLKKIAKEKSSTFKITYSQEIVTPKEKIFAIIMKVNPYLSSVCLSHSLDELGFTSIKKVQFYEELINCEGFAHLSLDAVLVARNLQELVNKANFQEIETNELKSLRSNVISVKSKSTAVIGMHIQVAGASNAEEFWDIIEQKKETITHNLPIDSQTELEQRYGGAEYIGSRGLLESEICKGFDARLFGVPETDATIMDPQQRALLQAVWNAFEIAGYDPIKFSQHGTIGVFAGTEFPSYLFNVLDTANRGQPKDHLVWQNLRDNIALRISREFDCRGPCLSVANNCSTFMVVLHLAHKSLTLHECDMAVVATATISGRQTGYLTSSKDIFSKDGHCRPFSSTASGTVMSDGVTVVILRRLIDAQKDDDDIQCIVKSTSIGSDGSLVKERQLTPSSVGQAEIIKVALENASESELIEFSSIGLIEAHGTGTAAGDQVELESLKKVSSKFNITSAIPIGSVKGNIGHTGVTSAGPAIVKAALALKFAKIPPSINCNDPSGHLKRTNFYVNTEMRQWNSPGIKRRVLVHSVGAMGSNAAAILEEYSIGDKDYESVSDEESENISFPVCISANSENSLKRMLVQLNDLICQNLSFDIKSMAYTLLYSRRFLPLRIAHVYSTTENLKECLSTSEMNNFTQAKVGQLCCVMFSGQGALIDVAALKCLCRILPRFKKELSDCFNLLKEISSDVTYARLDEVIFQSSSVETDVETKLKESVALQTTVIVCAQIALYRSLHHLGLKANCFLGHSLGEYTAACLAGAFSVKDVLYLLYQRGMLIENNVEHGEMISISASPGKVRTMCSTNYMPGVFVSCLNSPMHCVASGSQQDINCLSAYLTSQNIHHKKLKMNYAYHHPGMAVIQEEYSMILEKVNISQLKANLITSTEGCIHLHTAGTCIPSNYWLNHLVTPCDFLSTVSHCLSANCTDCILVELGVIPTLAHFIKATSLELGSMCVSVSMMSHHDKENIEKILLKDLTNIWKLGINVQLHSLPCFKTTKRIKLPLYPFDTKQYWKQQNLDLFPNSALEPKDTKPLSIDTVLEIIRRFTGPDYVCCLPVDSLLLVSLENKLFNCFGVSVSCNPNTNPNELAQYIVSQQNVMEKADPKVKVTCLSSPCIEDQPNIFIINAVDKKRHSFIPLGSMFSPYFKVYGLYAPTTIFNLKSVEDYAQLYLTEIRKIQNSGKFILGGFSFGAWIAHSIAHKLRSKDEELPTVLFLIDPPRFNSDESDFSNYLSSLISLGLGSVRTFTNSPVKETIMQYGKRFQKETKLLTKYQSSPLIIRCQTLIFLAMERMAFDYEQSDETIEYWSEWFAKELLEVKTIPGHHGTCFSALNGQCIVDEVIKATHLPVVSHQHYIPICSPDEIIGEWKITSSTQLSSSNLSVDHNGVLHFSGDGRYVCMDSSLLNVVGESHVEKIVICLFNSCGKYEAMSEPSNFKFIITFSHRHSSIQQSVVLAKLYSINAQLIIKVNDYEFIWQRNSTN